MSVIDEIKARVDIVELVSETVTLRKAGRSFKANCPFHAEKTPSFIVSPDRGSWHCFGSCATGGDIFGFVQKRDGVEFGEALRVLAERAGVTLETRDAVRSERFERLYEANQAAAVFYESRLRQSDDAATAREYLAKRGLDEETVRGFRLGYAPTGWDELRSHLERRGFTTAELLSAGLLVESERGGYDRFRGRLMFPIADERGRVAGFGGRTLGDDQAKYLNTAQTDIFDKSGLVYALDRAKEQVRAQDCAVIVEGYMDVIAAHQFGYTNVVASMGTALTERQVGLLKRFTRNLVLALDSDAAGSEATLRGIQVAVEAADHEMTPVLDWRGLIRHQDTLAADIRVVALPYGKDPDEAIREDPAAWPQIVATARPVLDHLLAVARERYDLEQPRERSRAIDTLMPALAALADPLIRAHYVQRLAAMARVDESVLMARLRAAPRTQRRAGGAERQEPAPIPQQYARDKREEFLLALLALHPSLRDEGMTLPPETFRLGENRALFQAWQAETPPAPGTPEAEQWERIERLELPPYDAAAAHDALESALRMLRRERLLEMKRLTTAALADELEGLADSVIAEDAMAVMADPRRPEATSAPVASLLRDLEMGQRLHELDLHRQAEPNTEKATPAAATITTATSTQDQEQG